MDGMLLFERSAGATQRWGVILALATGGLVHPCMAIAARAELPEVMTVLQSAMRQLGAGRLPVLRAAGPRPLFNSSDCQRLQSGSNAPDSPQLDSEDAKVVEEILRIASPYHGHVLFALAPAEIMWWVRRMGNISIVSIGVAVHEANHAVDEALTRCNSSFSTYSLEGRATTTEHRLGDTPQYSIIESAIPAQFKSLHPTSRYQNYVIRSAKYKGNDLSVLLDEFVAHTGAAAMELSLVELKDYAWLLPNVGALDSNAGGMAEFMLFVVSYLRATRLDYPVAYANLTRQPRLLDVLQRTWNLAETNLTGLYPHTLLAGTGGKLTVSREALAAAYSDELLTELDRLGVTHAPSSRWVGTYFPIAR